MTDYATLEKIDDVSVLSLDDGKVNVFSIEMLEAINNCLNDVPKDSDASPSSCNPNPTAAAALSPAPP